MFLVLIDILYMSIDKICGFLVLLSLHLFDHINIIS